MPSRAMEELGQALFEEANDALFLFDPETDELLAVNGTAERLTRISRAELMHKPATYWFRFGGAGKRSKEQLREQAGQSGVFHSQEGYYLRTQEGGVWIPVTLMISRLHVKPKTLALIAARDARMQREAEEKLKKANTFLESIVANVPLMLFVKDAESLRFEMFNKAGEELLGYRREDLIGKNDYDFFPKAEADFFIQKDREVLQGKKLVEITEEEIQTKSGLRTLHTLKIPILDEKGTPRYLLGISEDITDRKRLRNVVAQNEKLASIGRLSAGVAHEINNPLAVVSNNLTVLRRDCLGLLRLIEAYEAEREAVANGQPMAHSPTLESANQGSGGESNMKPVEEIAEEIDLPYVRDNLGRLFQSTQEGLDRVTRIVNSLRGHARIAPAQRREVFLPDLVETALEIVQVRLRERNITVERDFENPPRVRCIFSDIHQVVVNLFLNACQAIEAMPAEHEGRLRVEVRVEGEYALVAVTDNGCGIPPADVPCLFDPFFTTKDVREGSGLGLWISHSIVSTQGGRVEVDSQPGVGTTFRILLPLRQT